ncbi:GGDEF domain-containing protein [soil metagenome]
MAQADAPTSSTNPAPSTPPAPRWHGLQDCIDWLLAAPRAQPDEIGKELLHQRISKTKTLVVAVLGSLFLAAIAAALTGAAWAWAWLAAEVVLGSIRIYLLTKGLARARSGHPVKTIAPVWAGLTSMVLISVGCYQCVVSGNLPLILMAGIGLANLIGGIASRNAGTPRYGILLICVLALPFALAMLLSPIPFLFLIGLQTPVYTAGMVFLLLENHKVLLDLHHSERDNRLMAHHDLLTGLPNRALNLKLFAELLAAPQWQDTSAAKLTVFCLDLDGFKSVNDRLGHAAGDAVLVAVAKRLRASVREADFVCRLGGDEFVILLPNITWGKAAEIAQRIIADISKPFEFEPTVRVGVSIGIASAPRDGVTADELLSAADRAMYDAKRRGKGGFVVHSGAEIVNLAPSEEIHAKLPPNLANSAA